MNVGNRGTYVDTDVLILGSGAAGCGAALAAKGKDVDVVLLDKGKLESSGALGGGNDHFMAVLNSGPKTDSTEVAVNFFKTPLSGLTARMIEEGWMKIMPIILDVLQEVGVEFVKNPDGSWLRTVGFGQPGNWFINIRNGDLIKRLLAKKIRDLGVQVMDHLMVTKLFKSNGKIAGCVAFNVIDSSFYVVRAKTVISALGNTASRAWTNSTGNPYNIWQDPYNTGSQFVLAYDAGVKMFNLDIGQRATLIPKGFGAPGMNGINSMGGHELNALGERFMGKYDPMWENGLRINQIKGTYQELIDGKGPPFFMDMRHLDKNEVRHLQYVLMPGDKATYLDYCRQKGIEFAKDLLEVEISELTSSGILWTNENFETNISGLYNGCVFYPSFSGAMCGGYYAGLQAANTSRGINKLPELDDAELIQEKERVFKPLKTVKGMSYREIEGATRQVMNYYMGYRRSQKGMEIALEKLAFLEQYLDQLKASDTRELMKVHESSELIRMCKLSTIASMERKESGRTYYSRTDYPDLNPDLDKPLVIWQENGEPHFSWGV